MTYINIGNTGINLFDDNVLFEEYMLSKWGISCQFLYFLGICRAKEPMYTRKVCCTACIINVIWYCYIKIHKSKNTGMFLINPFNLFDSGFNSFKYWFYECTFTQVSSPVSLLLPEITLCNLFLKIYTVGYTQVQRYLWFCWTNVCSSL